MWNLKESIEQLFPQVVSWRRQLHMHPEIANQEVRTSQLITSVLENAGIQVTRYPESTAIVGTLVGDRPGRTIALRADMDALPIQEESGVEFCSQVAGKMHACGHDMHVSNLLGVACLLATNKDRVPGTVKFIFQPAEESGGSGGQYLVTAGVMDGIEKVFALHMQPELPTGQLIVTPGYCTSNSDSAVLTIHGKGGHGAHPEATIDAIVIGAQIVNALQTIVSRNVAAQQAGVVTIGTFHAGTVRNIISERAELQLSLRSLTKETQQLLKERIEQLAQGIAAAHGASCKFDYAYGYPSVFNHEDALQELLAAATPILGQDNVIVSPLASMVGEDFAYYAEKAPGVLFWLGARVPADEPAYPLHSPKARFNEACLKLGIEIMAGIVLNG
jgi:amidohydrolase